MSKQLVQGVLFAVTLSGCWPWIGDDWETEDTRGFVEVSRADFLGDYWESGGETYSASALFITTPQPFTWREYYVASGDGCQWGTTPLDGLTLYDPAASQLTLRSGGSSVTLPWDSASLAFNGTPTSSSWQWNAAYSLDTVSTNLGELGWSGALHTPNELQLLSPNLDAAEPPTLSVEGLQVSWNDAGASYYVVETQLVNAQGTAYEVSNCVTEGTSITLSASQFSNLSRAAYALLSVSAVRESAEVMPAYDAMLRFDGRHTLVGAFYLP